MPRLAALSIALLFAACAAPNVTGTWKGLIDPYGKKPAGILCVIEDKGGELTGTMAFPEDMSRDEMRLDNALTGSRNGTAASWIDDTDVKVKGHFEGDAFTGIIEFPAVDEHPPESGPMMMSRTAR